MDLKYSSTIFIIVLNLGEAQNIPRCSLGY